MVFIGTIFFIGFYYFDNYCVDNGFKGCEKCKHKEIYAIILFYFVGCSIILLVSEGSLIDVMALIAFCGTVASKFSEDLTSLRGYAVIAGAASILAGILALSFPAIIFNTLFVGGHILKLWQNAPSPQTARA